MEIACLAIKLFQTKYTNRRLRTPFCNICLISIIGSSDLRQQRDQSEDSKKTHFALGNDIETMFRNDKVVRQKMRDNMFRTVIITF